MKLVSLSQGFYGIKENNKPEHHLANSGARLPRRLSSDIITFGNKGLNNEPSRFVKEEEIHSLAREFSNKVNSFYHQTGRLSGKDLMKAVDTLIAGKGEVMIQHMSQHEMGAAAYCATGVDKQGNKKIALFVDFTVPVPELIENLVHEFTHVLQLFTEKQSNLADKSMKRGIEKHMALEEAANAYEDKLLYVVNEVLPKYEDAVNAKLFDPDVTLDSIVDEYKLVTPELFKEGLKEVQANYPVKNDPLALEYFLNKAKREAQAHREGKLSLKEAHGMSGMRVISDVIPVLYDRWAAFLEDKIAENREHKTLMLMA